MERERWKEMDGWGNRKRRKDADQKGKDERKEMKRGNVEWKEKGKEGTGEEG